MGTEVNGDERRKDANYLVVRGRGLYTIRAKSEVSGESRQKSMDTSEETHEGFLGPVSMSTRDG